MLGVSQETPSMMKTNPKTLFPGSNSPNEVGQRDERKTNEKEKSQALYSKELATDGGT